jgi:tetratricopeptide (TPR) repeat protein
MSARRDRGAPRQNPQIVRDLEAGLAYHKAGRRERAERLYRKVLRREPDHPDALRLLGVIASEQTSTMRLDFHPVRDGFHFALPALTIPEGRRASKFRQGG